MKPTINWDDTYKNNKDFQALSTADLSWVLSHTHNSNGLKVLDIGCGTGQLARDLYHRGYDILGVDISTQAILIAQQSTIHAGKGIEFSVANIEQVCGAENTYDLIFCKYVYTFLEDKMASLSKIKDSMNENSLFVIITPDRETLPPPKQHIAMDHTTILDQLSTVFSDIHYEKTIK